MAVDAGQRAQDTLKQYHPMRKLRGTSHMNFPDGACPHTAPVSSIPSLRTRVIMLRVLSLGHATAAFSDHWQL